MNAGIHMDAGSGAGISAQQALLLLSKVAETIMSPLRFVHHDHVAPVCSPLLQDQVDGLCKSPEMRRNLNQVVSETLGAKHLTIAPQTVADLRTTKPISDIFALITAPYDQIEDFLRQATAVRLQHAIRNCVLKADRERVRATLGDAAYNTAIREAPLFYANIVADVDHRHFAQDADDATFVLQTGATLFRSYIRDIDEGLAQLFAWRLPKDLIAGNVALDAPQIKSCTRLLAAKGPGLV